MSEELNKDVGPKEDQHNKVMSGIDIKIVENMDDLKDIILPTGKEEDFTSFFNIALKMDDDLFNDIFSKRDIEILNSNLASNKLAVLKGALDKINDEDLVNDINYGDKSLNARNVGVNKKGKVTGSAAIAVFNSIVGVGTTSQIPLWHSGFWVAIKPPTKRELINLEIALLENEIELGLETNTLIYSNYNVVFSRIVVDFILAHVVSYSIKLEPEEDIRSYIKVQDLYPLILGMVKNMYPTGYETSIPCVNTLKFDENKKPKCNHIANMKIKPENMLYVNRKFLTSKMLEHMSKRGTGVVSKESVIEYQKLLTVNDSKTFEVPFEDNIFKVTVQAPDLLSYINNGEMWVEEIKADLENTFKDNATPKEKNERLDELLKSVILCLYNSFVTEVRYQDSVTSLTENGIEKINEALETLSSTDETFKKFLEEIKNFILNITMAVVGTPNYTCPVCKEKQGDEDQIVIPSNVLQLFFELSELKIQNLKDRRI